MTRHDVPQSALRVPGKEGSPGMSGSAKRSDPPYSRPVQAAVIAILFFTPLIFPWRITKEAYAFTSFLVPKEAFVQFVVVLVCCYWLVAMIWGGKLCFRRSRLFLPLAVFTCLAGISITYSATRYNSALDFARMITVILFFTLVVSNFKRERDIRAGLQAIFLSGFIVAVVSLVQLGGGLSWLFPEYAGNPQRMYSTFGNDSGVAGYLLPVLPIGAGLFLVNGSKRSRLIYFVGIAAIAYAVLALQTRGVWLGVVAALVFFAVTVLRSKDMRVRVAAYRGYLLLALALVVIFLVVQSAFPGASTDETDTWTRISSAFEIEQTGVNQRGIYWGAALLMVADRPLFGFGLGTYKYCVPLYQGRLMAKLGPASRLQPNQLDTLRAHNDYIQLASELGCVGVAVLLWGGCVLCRNVKRTLKRGMDADSRCMFLASISGLVGVAVLALTNFPFHIVAHAVVAMFLLATVAGKCENEEGTRGKWRVPANPLARILISGCVVAIGLVFLGFLMRPHVADYHAASAYADEALEPESEAVLRERRETVRIEPRDGRNRAELGKAYLVRGMIEEAEEELTRALENYDSVWVHIDLGSACETQGNLDKAAEHFSNAVFRSPRYVVAHERLVRVLMKAGRYEDARKCCEEGLRWAGTVPKLLNARAEIAYHDGDRVRCVELLSKSLQIKPAQQKMRMFLESVEKGMDENRSPS